jgi:phage protein D
MAAGKQGATSPAFSIRVGGSSIPPAARGSVVEIVAEEALDLAGFFAIELDNWDADKHVVTWSDDALFAPGAVVQIELGYDDSTTLVFTGEVTGLDLSFPDHAHSLVVVRGYDRMHRVRRGRRTASYLQAKDSDVATKIANDLGLTPDVDASAEVHPYLLQTNQTDIDFLLTRARAIGYELSVDDKTLRFKKLKNTSGKTATYSISKEIVTFSAYLSTADQVSAVSVRGWDPAKKQALVGKAQTGDVNKAMSGTSGPKTADGLFGTRTLTVVEHPVRTQSEADLLAKGLLDELALDYIVADATLLGDPTIKVGTVLELDGLGKRFSGPYYVTRVRHVVAGTYLTHVHARRNAA